MKQLTPQQLTEKIKRYCAYQERSHYEVRQKLYELGAPHRDIDEIISTLITENFLNEERFAKAFAGGKFRIKKWGRLKIVNELEKKGISKNCIKAGLREIDQQDYEETLSRIINQKSQTLEESNIFVLRDKISTFAIQKGYEPELVWKLLKEILPDKK